MAKHKNKNMSKNKRMQIAFDLDEKDYKKNHKSIVNEFKFQRWFEKFGRLSNFINIEREIQLFPAVSTLNNDRKGRIIGKIDFKFIYKSKRYLCECKYYRFGNSDFWESLKILGYCKYYNWQNNTKYKPAIMVDANNIKLEHFMVANFLKFKIFGITENGNNTYKVKEMLCSNL